MGPNIRHLPDRYWDHYLALTDASLKEGLISDRFRVSTSIGKFLPYSMAQTHQYPVFFLKLYLKLPVLWRVFGKQFLVVATKPDRVPTEE